jgi:hypothetical protein
MAQAAGMTHVKAYVPFTSGRRVAVDVIRNELTYLPVDALADISDLPTADFLEQLETWATSIGLPYGITVDREAQTITVAGRGVVAQRDEDTSLERSA